MAKRDERQGVFRLSVIRQQRQLVLDKLSGLPRQGIWLGASGRYVTDMVVEYGLSMDDLDIIIELRVAYRAKVGVIKQLLKKGFDMPDIHGIYRAHHGMHNALHKNEDAVSVNTIAKFVQTFASCDPEWDDLGECLLETHRIVRACCPWVEYPNESLVIVCMIGSTFGVADLETALKVLREQRYLRRGCNHGGDENRDMEGEVDND